MRKLQPCGTRAAYARHLRNNEEPCTECKAANVARVQSAPSGGNNSTSREVIKLEQSMADRPPRIEWRLDPIRRIQVAWLIDDPYMDHGPSPLRQQRQIEHYAKKRAAAFPAACEHGHEFDSWNTIVNPDGSFECRTCTTPQDSSLLAAARTDI